MKQHIRRLKGFDPEWFDATVHKLQKGHIRILDYWDALGEFGYVVALEKYFQCQWPDTMVCMRFHLSQSTLCRKKRKLFDAIWKDYQDKLDKW